MSTGAEVHSPSDQQTSRKYRASLRDQLVFWFFLLSFAPLVLVSWLGYQEASRSLIEAAERDLITTAAEKKRFLDNWFHYRRADLAQLASENLNAEFLLRLREGLTASNMPAEAYIKSYQWAELTDQYKDDLLDTFLGYDYFYDLFLIDLKGNILFTLANETDLGTNLITGAFSETRFAETVKETLSSGNMLFSDFERYTPSNDIIAGFITAQILNDAGERIGVFAIQLRVDRINHLLKNNLEDYQVHYLIGEDRLLRTALGTNTHEVLTRPIITAATENLSDANFVESPHESGDYSMTQTYQGPDSTPVIGLVQAVDIWNVQWYLVSEADQSRALASATLLGRLFTTLCVISLLVALILAFMIARTITQPLEKLAKISYSAAKGETDQKIDISSNNEIGRLSSAFNTMLKSRHEFEKTLEKSNKEAQNALAELADQRFALDQHAIVAITDLKGTITYANSRFSAISGYTQEELLGKNHRILNSGAHPKAYFTEMYRTIGKGQVWHGEFCNKRKDGKLYWVDTTITPFMGADGKPINYIAIRTDITERKHFEMELLHSKQEAVAAAKAKSEFLASMSHEIRTPMNGVLGMLGLMEKTPLSDIQKRYTTLARASAESLLTLINDILDFSKVDAGKLDIEELDFNLPQVFSEFAESMALRAQEKGLELILDISQVTRPMVKSDPGRLRQVLTNLVSNAIKFTEHGEILITAKLEERESDLRLFCEVKDTGIGIPPGQLNAIFDAFRQVDASTTRRYGGTGLGLAIVKRLCQLMGGDISVRSQSGKGSQFSFHLKLGISDQTVNSLPGTNIRGARVMVVDDNHTNCEVMRGQLSLWGAEVAVCNKPEDALAMLLHPTNSEERQFDVAILDYQMPEMDGAELGRLIRQEAALASLKLIVMTSIAERGDARFFADIGFDAYFPKPATPSDLHDALSIVIDRGDALSQATPLVTSHYVRSLSGRTEYDAELPPTDGFVWPEQLRILLVEDNHVNQVVAQGLLEQLDLTCDIAGDGKEAIDALKQSEQAGHPYSMILMDCQMPIMDGYEATRQIRQGRAGAAFTEITIIAMTANAMKGDREKCIEAGMDDYLAKPIDNRQLKITLNQHIFGTTFESTETVMEATDEIGVRGTPEEPQIWNKPALLARIGQREELVTKMIATFLKECPRHLGALESAFSARDAGRIRDACHTIKGMASNIGAEKLESLADMTEQTLASDTPPSAAMLEAIRSAITELHQAFDVPQSSPD